MLSAGTRFRKALTTATQPLRIVGTINAYAALLAEHTGHHALYLSGAGVANSAFGLPDLSLTTLSEVVEEARRITAVTELPLLVDIDTGFGGAFNIARTLREMQRAGVAAVHMEDQIGQKRCGHRPNKILVSTAEMTDRIKAAVDAREDQNFVIMARTDALASEGLEASIARMQAYVAAGANMIFAEAVTRLEQYQKITQVITVPVLANMTEFGKTPLFTVQELASAGIAMVLYPLTAFRAMSQAAQRIYEHLAQGDNQEPLLKHLQTREELYAHLNYYQYENKLDTLFGDDNT